jgi:hypothetical protein
MKRLNEIFCTNICLTSRKSIMVVVGLLISGLVIASVWSDEPHVIETETPPVETNNIEVWIPTEEDIKYQDSMFCIIEQTQMDVDTIKQDIDKILYKLDRLEYDDGTYDSIRVRK